MNLRRKIYNFVGLLYGFFCSFFEVGLYFNLPVIRLELQSEFSGLANNIGLVGLCQPFVLVFNNIVCFLLTSGNQPTHNQKCKKTKNCCTSEQKQHLILFFKLSMDSLCEIINCVRGVSNCANIFN